jgi:DNA-damage-inducible protein J
MPATAVVRARIDEKVKRKASKTLEKMGLSVSDAIRLLMIRVADEKALPFELRVPNAETEAAMNEARRGGLQSARTIGELKAQLNEAD